ncbi:hypothetical protein ABN12_000363 [Salmonella enterica subsp. enterica serovar Mississippi]|nr:hypothetical protein [Salmonella enterica subsp. enterica serovar Mississippi]ECA6119145.1 hypothetical protein [Salmonella enterica subsp. enterica serovar Redlands]ECG7133262.1 hypothetical protein [Salmonella enterica subsp. enterica serovar Uppsala]ECH8810937.1 hypothetical protein [Salmonella enterica subsp. enterica]ECL8865256.1 hypothetical protein [Salmonella enterica subsp. enterica serovar Ibadan]EGT7892614.1 hypothetical protein [Salmonella enterica]
MKENSSKKSDSWTVFFDGLVEAIKMIFSIVMAIVVAGSKTTNSSAEDKTLHAGYRHNNDKAVHFDNDA